MQIEANSVNMENNINWAMSCDCGGEGPTADDETHVEHFVYLAVKPLPHHRELMAGASAHH